MKKQTLIVCMLFLAVGFYTYSSENNNAFKVESNLYGITAEYQPTGAYDNYKIVKNSDDEFITYINIGDENNTSRYNQTGNIKIFVDDFTDKNGQIRSVAAGSGILKLKKIYRDGATQPVGEVESEWNITFQHVGDKVEMPVNLLDTNGNILATVNCVVVLTDSKMEVAKSIECKLDGFDFDHIFGYNPYNGTFYFSRNSIDSGNVSVSAKNNASVTFSSDNVKFKDNLKINLTAGNAQSVFWAMKDDQKYKYKIKIYKPFFRKVGLQQGDGCVLAVENDNYSDSHHMLSAPVLIISPGSKITFGDADGIKLYVDSINTYNNVKVEDCITGKNTNISIKSGENIFDLSKLGKFDFGVMMLHLYLNNELNIYVVIQSPFLYDSFPVIKLGKYDVAPDEEYETSVLNDNLVVSCDYLLNNKEINVYGQIPVSDQCSTGYALYLEDRIGNNYIFSVDDTLLKSSMVKDAVWYKEINDGRPDHLARYSGKWLPIVYFQMQHVYHNWGWDWYYWAVTPLNKTCTAHEDPDYIKIHFTVYMYETAEYRNLKGRLNVTFKINLTSSTSEKIDSISHAKDDTAQFFTDKAQNL